MFSQAKLRSSLSWLLSKVYGCNVPKELQDPFYQTAEVGIMSHFFNYCDAKGLILINVLQKVNINRRT